VLRRLLASFRLLGLVAFGLVVFGLVVFGLVVFGAVGVDAAEDLGDGADVFVGHRGHVGHDGCPAFEGFGSEPFELGEVGGAAGERCGGGASARGYPGAVSPGGGARRGWFAWWSGGVAGGYVGLNGGGGSISNVNPLSTSSLTFEVWMRASSGAPTTPLGWNNNYGYGLFLESDGRVRAAAKRPGVSLSVGAIAGIAVIGGLIFFITFFNYTIIF